MLFARAPIVRVLRALLVLAPLAIVVACRPKEPPEAAAIDAAPPADAAADARDTESACAADQDCAPLNCCFATSESSCIPRARAHCEGFSVQCGENTGARYDCMCSAGKCASRLVAPAPRASAAAPASPFGRPLATGELKSDDVVGVVAKHAADVRACRAQAKGLAGTVIVTWDVKPSGAVEHTAVAASSITSPKLTGCLVKKIGAWRFPKAKGGTHVSYPFQFSS